MVGRRKLPKALSKNPKPFVDVSAGLMNVPGSVSKLRTDGGVSAIDPIARSEGRKTNRVLKTSLKTKRPNTFISRKANGRGFKAGKREGTRLTKIGSRRASRILRS